MTGQGCDRCGAALAADGACGYCGAPTVAAPAPPPVPPPEPTLADRVRALRRSPEYDRLADAGSVAAPLPWSRMIGIVVGLGFVVVSTSMRSFHREHFSDPFFDRSRSAFDSFPILFTLLGAGIALWHLFAFVRVAASPVVPEAAAVVSKRTHVTTGEHGSTTYHVCLESASGRRREVAALAEAWSSVREDEIGVAFLRRNELVAFRRGKVARATAQ